MITAAEPPSHSVRAFAGSLALHACVLALLAALVPAWNALSDGNLLRESATCIRPCSILMVRVAPRTAAAAYLEPRASHARFARPSRTGSNARAAAQEVTVRAGSAGGFARPTALAINPPSKIVAIPFVAPPASVAIEDVALTQRASLVQGHWGWGSRFDTPTLRDRVLYAELLEKLPKGSIVTIVVDDRGRATGVRIVAPGLDGATIADFRARLLAARYAPVERDGVAFSGSLLIRR